MAHLQRSTFCSVLVLWVTTRTAASFIPRAVACWSAACGDADPVPVDRERPDLPARGHAGLDLARVEPSTKASTVGPAPETTAGTPSAWRVHQAQALAGIAGSR